MKLVRDTNVVLDVLLDRAPHSAASSIVLALAEKGRIEGLVCATSVTTLHYIVSKASGARRARDHVRRLLAIIDVAPVNRSVLHSALALGFPDFEDAVVHEAARQAGAQGIVTRDRTGFSRASLPVHSPEEILAALRTA